MSKEFLAEGKKIAKFIGKEAQVVHAGVSPIAEASYRGFKPSYEAEDEEYLDYTQPRRVRFKRRKPLPRSRVNWNNLGIRY